MNLLMDLEALKNWKNFSIEMPEFCGRRFGSFFDTQLEWRIFQHKKAKYHQLLQEYGSIPSLLYTKKIGHNKKLMKATYELFEIPS